MCRRGRPIKGSSDHCAVVDHGELVVQFVAAGKVRGADASDELQVVGSEARSTFEDGNDATITKTLVCSIFVEVKTTLLLVIEKVEVFVSKLLDLSFVLPSCEVGRAINAEAICMDF